VSIAASKVTAPCARRAAEMGPSTGDGSHHRRARTRSRGVPFVAAMSMKPSPMIASSPSWIPLNGCSLLFAATTMAFGSRTASALTTATTRGSAATRTSR
jgi:hypothetical protein